MTESEARKLTITGIVRAETNTNALAWYMEYMSEQLSKPSGERDEHLQNYERDVVDGLEWWRLA